MIAREEQRIPNFYFYRFTPTRKTFLPSPPRALAQLLGAPPVQRQKALTRASQTL